MKLTPVEGNPFEAQPKLTPVEGNPFEAETKERTGGVVSSILEPAAAIVSGIVAEPLAGLSGLTHAISPFSNSDNAAKAVESAKETLTYQPKTDTGKDALGGIAETLEPIGDAFSSAEQTLGDATMNATGSPALAAAATSIPTAALEILGLGAGGRVAKSAKNKRAERSEILGRIIEGDPDAEVAKYMVDGSGKLKNDAAAKSVIELGVDEGVVAMAKGASESDKAKMLKMLNVHQKGFNNPKYQALNRASDTVGNSIIERFNIVKNANIAARSELDSVAKALKTESVDVAPAVDSFIDDLSDMGIEFNKNTLKLNYKNSDVQGLKGIQKTINKVIERMADTRPPTAYDVHRMKRFIDEHVTYGKSQNGLGGKAEFVIKSLRRNLDGILDENFPEYDRVNTTYAETITAIDRLQEVAGSKIDLDGNSVDAAIGTLSGRILSNAQSRTPVFEAFKLIEDVAKKNGGVFNDDIVTQVVFFDELKKVFGTPAKSSIQGEITKGGMAVAEDAAAQATMGLPTGSTLGWLKGIIGRNADDIDPKRYELLRELLTRKEPVQ